MAGFMPHLIRRLQTEFANVDGVKGLLFHIGHDLEDLLEHLASMASMPYVKAFVMEKTDGLNESSLPPLPSNIDPDGAMSANGPRMAGSVASRLRAAVHKAVIQQYRLVDREKAISLYAPFLDLLFAHFAEQRMTERGTWPGLRSGLLPIFTTNYDPAIEVFCSGRFSDYALIDGFKYGASGYLVAAGACTAPWIG